MIEVETVHAVSTIRLLQSIEAFYPMLALIHVFLDNARYHHAKLVQDWLSRPDCRIRLHFIPALLPALEPDRAVVGHMHKHVTHNKIAATTLHPIRRTRTLDETVPRNWADLCNSVTDNFRAPFRIRSATGQHRQALSLVGNAASNTNTLTASSGSTSQKVPTSLFCPMPMSKRSRTKSTLAPKILGYQTPREIFFSARNLPVALHC